MLGKHRADCITEYNYNVYKISPSPGRGDAIINEKYTKFY